MRVIKMLNQKGFSITELLIAAGLTGMMALMTSKIMKDQTENDALIKAKAEISKAVSLVEKVLRDESHCTLAMQGADPGGAYDSIVYHSPTVSKEIIGANIDYGSFKTGVIRLTASSVGTGMMDLVIPFQIKVKNITIERRIPLLVSLLPDGRVSKCGAFLGAANIQAEQEFCTSLGPTVATWNGIQCVLNDMLCPYGQIVDKMPKFGQLDCVPIQSKLSLPDLFDMSSKNCVGKPVFNLAVVGGKITINCQP